MARKLIYRAIDVLFWPGQKVGTLFRKHILHLPMRRKKSKSHK
jgi:hypothetical protein